MIYNYTTLTFTCRVPSGTEQGLATQFTGCSRRHRGHGATALVPHRPPAAHCELAQDAKHAACKRWWQPVHDHTASRSSHWMGSRQIEHSSTGVAAIRSVLAASCLSVLCCRARATRSEYFAADLDGKGSTECVARGSITTRVGPASAVTAASASVSESESARANVNSSSPSASVLRGTAGAVFNSESARANVRSSLSSVCNSEIVSAKLRSSLSSLSVLRGAAGGAG